MEFDSFIRVFDTYLGVDSNQSAFSYVGGLATPVVAALTGKHVGSGQYPFLHRSPLVKYTMDPPESIELPQCITAIDYLARNESEQPTQEELNGLWQLILQGNIRIPRLTHEKPESINSLGNNPKELSYLVDSIVGTIPVRVEESGINVDPDIGIGVQERLFAFNYGGEEISFLATEPPSGYKVRNLADLVTDQQILIEAMEGIIMQRIVEEKSRVPILYENALLNLEEEGLNGYKSPPVSRILEYMLYQKDIAENQTDQTLGRQSVVTRRSFATKDRALFNQIRNIAQGLFDEIRDYEFDKKHKSGSQVNEMLGLLSAMRLIIPESASRYSQDHNPSSGREMQTELGINPNSIGMMFGSFYRIGKRIQSKPKTFEGVRQSYARSGMILVGDRMGELPTIKPTASYYDDVMENRVFRITAGGAKAMIGGNYVTKKRAAQTMNIYGLSKMMQFVHEINFLSPDEFNEELARKVRFV